MGIVLFRTSTQLTSTFHCVSFFLDFGSQYVPRTLKLPGQNRDQGLAKGWRQSAARQKITRQVHTQRLFQD